MSDAGDGGRAEKRRAAARAKYYARHPVRPAPVCAVCGEAIDWTPGRRGRPPKYHPEHRPSKRKRNREG